MTTTTEITPTEQADRAAIRELVDAYVHCDTFVKVDGDQLSAERNLYVGWTETLSSRP